MAGETAAKKEPPGAWAPERSAKLYGIDDWGAGYYRVDPAGHVVVTPRADGRAVDLYNLAKDLEERGHAFPLLVRFPDILESQVRRISEAFYTAIQEYQYAGAYRGVFPIKVNQQRHVVEDLLRVGKPYQIGLEAGSKPELMIALAMPGQTDGLIICNGYKDPSYIETALLAQRIGRRPIVVVERFQELEFLIAASRRLAIEPIIGLRARLGTQGSGRWEGSGGHRAKFGLTATEMMEAVERLKAAQLLPCLKLLHFHIGSQITRIAALKEAVREASRFFVELVDLGAPLEFLDVGGGLGVDYDGSQTESESSRNYSAEEYAASVVSLLDEACKARQVKPPTIITEAGRALLAYSSVLVVEVLDHDKVDSSLPASVPRSAHQTVRELSKVLRHISSKNYQEAYHDAVELRDEALTLFKLGFLRLAERADVERLFWAVSEKVLGFVRADEYPPPELAGLESSVADRFYCNFSVFQSTPDIWAVDQLFPIMPIHRLDEEPARRGVLADLTCDSDGKIDCFIDFPKPKSALELHAPKPGEPYLVGIFLVGAYQEILGDLHNLFGDTNVAHVLLTDEAYRVESVVAGDSIAEVLGYVQYDRDTLLDNMRRAGEQSVQEKRLTLEQYRLLMRHYEASLAGYTYLVAENGKTEP
ncbi:MAG: biosynthetic arginine decarboxylase [Planctomycetes bacterium]|nr:biosynthetic arginine decarboxylase [Planctomycetota bacterium]